MSNPWLGIPLADYEGHMSLPQVGQAHLLAEVFDRAIKRWAPANIALIGCAGGNGFERLAAGTMDRLVGVDVNPDYIEQARRRHAQRLSNIELLCADVQSQSLTYGPVDFTYAALLFEYVDMTAALDTLKRNSRPNARLTTVVQLAHSTLSPVSSSPYRSLGRLAPIMKLVVPEELRGAAAQAGFGYDDSEILTLASGKQFCVQNFRA
jgi:ubiquinone/menaquinone biosynthesis C-methylase UbiE